MSEKLIYIHKIIPHFLTNNFRSPRKYVSSVNSSRSPKNRGKFRSFPTRIRIGSINTKILIYF